MRQDLRESVQQFPDMTGTSPSRPSTDGDLYPGPRPLTSTFGEDLPGAPGRHWTEPFLWPFRAALWCLRAVAALVHFILLLVGTITVIAVLFIGWFFSDPSNERTLIDGTLATVDRYGPTIQEIGRMSGLEEIANKAIEAAGRRAGRSGQSGS